MQRYNPFQSLFRLENVMKMNDYRFYNSNETILNLASLYFPLYEIISFINS